VIAAAGKDERLTNRVGSAFPAVGSGPLATSAERGEIPPSVRLQILTTEHWSLLTTRTMSWNESFARATMFLSALSGTVVALALVGGMTRFEGAFVTFALLVLPVVLFIGVATFRRLIEINREEDVRWVIGMNRLRHAYLESAPELQPYFVSGWSDDESGIMRTFGATPGPGAITHEFVTTPGLIAVINGVLAGTLAAIGGFQLGFGLDLAAVMAIAIGLVTVAFLAILQYRLVVRANPGAGVQFRSSLKAGESQCAGRPPLPAPTEPLMFRTQAFAVEVF
jgi:hypothetical protein